MKKFFSNPWVLGTIVVLAVAGIYLYFRNKNKNNNTSSGTGTGRSACVKCYYPCGTTLSGNTKYCQSCEDIYGNCNGNPSIRVIPTIINTGVGPGHAGNNGGMGSGDTGTGGFGGTPHK